MRGIILVVFAAIAVCVHGVLDLVCDANTFCDGTGDASNNGACKNCPAGTTNLAAAANTFCGGSSSKTFCTTCPGGQFSAAGDTCQNCPAGKHLAQSDLTLAQFNTRFKSSHAGNGDVQALGYTLVSSTNFQFTGDTCSACAAGQFSGGGQATCTPCSAGRFQTGTGQTECSLCQAGKFSATAGAVSCADCTAGQTSDAGASACSSCAKGKYASANGGCSACPAGTIAGEANSCRACPRGRHAASGSITTVPPPSPDIAGEAGALACSACDGYLRVEQVFTIANGVQSTTSKPLGTECIKLGPLQSLEWWGLLLIILGSGVLAVVLARVVLRRTNAIGNAVYTTSGARGAFRGFMGDHPSTTFNNAPVSPREVEMDKLQPTQSLNY